MAGGDRGVGKVHQGGEGARVKEDDFRKAYDAWDGQGQRPPEVTEYAWRLRQGTEAYWLYAHPTQARDARAASEAGRSVWGDVIAEWQKFYKTQEQKR